MRWNKKNNPIFMLFKKSNVFDEDDAIAPNAPFQLRP